MNVRRSRWLDGLVPSRPSGSGRDAGRRVLVLQGELALWTLWRDDRPVDERVERLDGDAAATRCPWPVGEGGEGAADGQAMRETFVDVVADSPLDEVERVVADGPPGGPEAGPPADAARGRRGPGRLARWWLARRLGRRYAGAIVQLAPPGSGALLAVLLRAELPEDWRERLETLQRGTVTVRALHSALRLREPSGDERRGDVLRVFRGGGTERHLLYRRGCPTFTRVVRPSDASVDALAETRDYLVARHGASALREVGDIAGGDGRAVADDGFDDLADARRLAALVAGASPSANARRRSRIATADPLLEKWRRHVELRRLHAATAATALVAGVTVLASVAHGIDGARDRARAIAAREALVARVEGLSGALDARHPGSPLADASLARLDREDAARAPDAIDVLGALAAVLTRHPGVVLDRLAWSTAPAEEPGGTAFDDGRVDAPSSLPARRPTTAAGDGTVAPRVARLEIAGRIDAGEGSSVRERQVRFEAFVDALGRETGFTGLEVRRSPAAAAAEGRGSARASADGAGEIDYELRLRRVREGSGR